MAYRMTPAMRSTEFSPYFLVFGREMLTPIGTEMIPPEDVANTHAQHLKQIIQNLRLATTLAKENVKHNIERNSPTLYYSITTIGAECAGRWPLPTY